MQGLWYVVEFIAVAHPSQTMMITAIDPGPTSSQIVMLKDGEIFHHDFMANEHMLGKLSLITFDYRPLPNSPPQQLILAIEMIGHYGTGMPAGKEVFDTCVWIGRFTQLWFRETGNMPTVALRPTIKTHLCGNPRAKDPNVRQALIDRYGGKAAIKRGGPLYGITKHAWAALALAIFVQDTYENKALLPG